MSESKHTPGEWLLVDHTVYALNDQGENRFTALVQGGWVHRGSFSSERTSEDEKSANAHLIASAPDLLEALKGAVGALEFSRDYHKDLGNEEQAFAQDRLDAATKAIAKATGAA